MLRPRLLTLTLTLTAALFSPKPGTADPISITSGFLRVTGVQDLASRGFLRTIAYDFSTDEYRLRWSESDGPVQAVLAPRLLSPSLWTPIDGSEELVAVALGTLTVDAVPGAAPSPFVLSGRVRLADLATGATIVDRVIFGAGGAHWQFVTNHGGGQTLSGALFEFGPVAPTPEPATVLLLGAGLAGLAALRRRRRPGATGQGSDVPTLEDTRTSSPRRQQ
jgi:hypothetical protein